MKTERRFAFLETDAAFPKPDKHRYVVSLKQSTRVWGVRVDLVPALER